MNRETNSEFYSSLSCGLNELKSSGNFRTLTSVPAKTDSLINLSSNDYLGLNQLKTDLPEFNDKRMGSASSRLLTGNSKAYEELEDLLTESYSEIAGPETAALVFNSGYHANTGILPAITDRDDLILSDKLNHASIIDGAGLSRATTIRFPHKDYKKLREILVKRRDEFRKAVIVSESVFSMDGDSADLKLLVQLKKEFDCLLYIDEAHSCGVYGNKGLGLCESTSTARDIDIILGTFGKAYASLGAYAITRPVLREYLINRCRSLIFTTALPPLIVEWSCRSFRLSLEMTTERQELNLTSHRLREELNRHGLSTGGDTHIVPVYTGSSSKAVDLAGYLKEQGFLLFPIRPPTVPPNKSRIRISLTSAIKWEKIARLPELISSTGAEE